MYLFIVKNKNSMNIFIQPFNYTFLLKFGLGNDSIETGLDIKHWKHIRHFEVHDTKIACFNFIYIF